MSPQQLARLKQVKGVIFDLDGTLVDSTLNFAQIRADINCPQGVDTLKFIESMATEQQKQQAHNIILAHEMRDAAQSKWLPSAEQLVHNLSKANIPQAIVTRNCEQASRLKIRNNQIAIDLVITREHFPPKPAPDALLHIARQWQLATNNLMYVGDFKYDIEAGNNAGMISCLITHGKDIHFEHQADLVIERLDVLNGIIAPAN